MALGLPGGDLINRGKSFSKLPAPTFTAAICSSTVLASLGNGIPCWSGVRTTVFRAGLLYP